MCWFSPSMIDFTNIGVTFIGIFSGLVSYFQLLMPQNSPVLIKSIVWCRNHFDNYFSWPQYFRHLITFWPLSVDRLLLAPLVIIKIIGWNIIPYTYIMYINESLVSAKKILKILLHDAFISCHQSPDIITKVPCIFQFLSPSRSGWYKKTGVMRSWWGIFDHLRSPITYRLAPCKFDDFFFQASLGLCLTSVTNIPFDICHSDCMKA